MDSNQFSEGRFKVRKVHAVQLTPVRLVKGSMEVIRVRVRKLEVVKMRYWPQQAIIVVDYEPESKVEPKD